MDNIKEITFESWVEFQEFIVDEKIKLFNYIYRGQRIESWSLKPRIFRNRHFEYIEDIFLEDHLRKFKYAIRGRRGINSPELKKDNDWWSLGQHYGLDTPLLDWTTSPFVGAYFAFYEDKDTVNNFRVVFALNKSAVEERNKIIELVRKTQPYHTNELEIFSPITDENPRLVSQSGLFTRIPNNYDIEKWIKEQFKDESINILYKFKIPENEREIILRALNKMNINHLSLFPDITGTSVYCNMSLTIENY